MLLSPNSITLSVIEYAPEISDVNSSRKNLPKFLLEQKETFTRSFSLNGACISSHSDSKKLLLIELRSFRILRLNVFVTHIPTPPPLVNCVNFDLL